MKLGGLMKNTLLDFPGKVACTVFTCGCNLRCPFCHNSSLVLGKCEPFPEEAFFSFLKKRQGLLDGVAISGGEPLLNNDIFEFISKIKQLGFAVKLDTNGTFPKKLKKIIDEETVDYIAVDIKNSPLKYRSASGGDCLEQVKQSIDILRSGNVPYEFRTTAVSELHTADDFREIGKLIEGAEKYYIQSYVSSDDILDSSKGFTSPSDQAINEYLNAILPYVPNAELRGR